MKVIYNTCIMSSFIHRLGRQSFCNVLSFCDAVDLCALTKTLHFGKWSGGILKAQCVLAQIGKKFAALLNKETHTLLKQHGVFNPLYPSDFFSRVEHIRAVCLELTQDHLSDYDKQLILLHILKMTSRHPNPECTPLHSSLVNVQEKFDGTNIVHIKPGIKIAVLSEGSEQIAKIMALPELCTGKLANMRKYKPRHLNANCAAYEMMHALGSSSVAPTQRLPSGLVVQHYIHDSHTLCDAITYDVRAAKQLMSISVIEIALHAILGLLRGREDGHDENIILFQDKQKKYHLCEVDQEKDFIKQNMIVRRTADELEGQWEPLLGLPQAAFPLPQSVLKLFCWSGLKDKCVTIFKKYDLGNPSALIQRCDKIQALCRAATAEKTRQITPRQFYFALYGRDFLFEKCIKLGMPPYLFFSKAVQWTDSLEPNFELENSNANMLALAALEPSASFTFSMLTKSKDESLPGEKLTSRLSEKIWEQDTVKCFEIPKGAFNLARYNLHLENHPNATCSMRSFLLSDCLEGFAKRMARQFSINFPICPLEVVRDDNKCQWLIMHSHPA